MPQAVNKRTLGELCAHLRVRRPLLLSLPRCSHQDLNAIPYARLKALRPDTLVHALVHVTHTNMVKGNTIRQLCPLIKCAILFFHWPTHCKTCDYQIGHHKNAVSIHTCITFIYYRAMDFSVSLQ